MSEQKHRWVAWWIGFSCSAQMLACQAELGGSPSDGRLGSPPAGSGSDEVISLPGGLELKGAPAYYRVVRLTHQQWERSVRDVLLLDDVPGESATFLPDPPDGKFSNNERALYVSDTLSSDYARSAEKIALRLANNSAELLQLGSAADSASLIAQVGRRAFRRPLSPDEQAKYQTLFDLGPTYFASGDAFADGVRLFVEALLQSPFFVYRVELTPPGMRLSGLELATKLSFLIRGTTPDDALLDAASAGTLDTDLGVRSLLSTWLEEAGAQLAIQGFHRELFGLDRYRSIEKSTTAFPNFTPEWIPSLIEADLKFFDQIYTQKLGFREILTSNLAFVDSRTAPLYGLSSASDELTQVALDASRPGYLTRVGFLAYNANLRDPDPIHRGVDIQARILCTELSPPPGEIPPLPDPEPGQTNRERVEAHTGAGLCAGCHKGVINPPGFALEAFDALGQARSTDNGKPIDTSGTLSAGEVNVSFSNITELSTQLAQNPVAHSCYAAHLAEYAFARDLGQGEAAAIHSLQEQSLNSSASLQQMLLELLSSPAFTQATRAVP